MNRSLQYFNLAGVLALAALCVCQWQANRRVNLEATALERTRLEQAARLEEQGRTVKGLAADLDSFRGQLGAAAASQADTEKRLSLLEHENRQLTNERDQLKISVTRWAAAVAQRDERIKAADVTLQQAGMDRNDAVKRFNELAARHNEVVGNLNTRTEELNQLATRYNNVVSNLNFRTTEFNSLVEKYRALAASTKRNPSE